MRTKTRAIVFALLPLLSFAPPAQSQPDLTRLVPSAPLVFRGTIVGTESPTLPLPPPKGRVVRVRVEETFRGAATVGDFTGQEIVLVRSGDADRKSGVFFVRPLAYGKTLAAEEIAAIDAPSDPRAFAALIARIERQDEDAKLAARLRSADAVIVGRVLAVKAVREGRGGPSEHDPDWAVAQVLVVRRLKGEPRVRDCAGGACVDVAFAQSDDIRWFRSPKLVVGREAIFLLRPPDPKLLRQGEVPPAPYVLIDPDDLRPVAEIARVRNLIRGMR